MVMLKEILYGDDQSNTCWCYSGRCLLVLLRAMLAGATQGDACWCYSGRCLLVLLRAMLAGATQGYAFRQCKGRNFWEVLPFCMGTSGKSHFGAFMLWETSHWFWEVPEDASDAGKRSHWRWQVPRRTFQCWNACRWFASSVPGILAVRLGKLPIGSGKFTGEPIPLLERFVLVLGSSQGRFWSSCDSDLVMSHDAKH